jgi:uncharacterized protein
MWTTMIEPFEVFSGGLKVQGIATFPETCAAAVPCVLLSHGLVSSKESTKYVALSEALATLGIASCRFDFHGCGESDGRIEDTSLSLRVENLEQVIQWARDHRLVDGRRIGLQGSSFGGSTSLVVAARDNMIVCTSLWSTPYVLDNKEDSSIAGIDFSNVLFDDFAAYDLLAEAEKVSRTLVVHGEIDDVVPLAEGKAIFDRLKDPKKFELIAGGDHAFTELSHRDQAIGHALAWFATYLTP